MIKAPKRPQPNRLDTRFAALKAAKKKAFIGFLTAGFPDLDLFPRLLEGLPGAGVDIIEIGMPFSDPMADGPIIQAANLQAFKAGITVPKILEFIAAFREKDKETPIVLMGYYNPIYSHGVRQFIDDAAKAGADGFIIPDLPPEEDSEFREPAKKKDLRFIRLIAPTTPAARLPLILEGCSGFAYYVAVTGITGSKSAHAADLKEGLARIKAQTDLPVCVGFGVKTPEQAQEMASSAADGVIVASSILQKIGTFFRTDGTLAPEACDDALAYVAELADAVHSR